MLKLPINANYNLDVDRYYKLVSYMGTVMFVQIIVNTNKHLQIYTVNEFLIYPVSGGCKQGRGKFSRDIDGIVTIYELDADDVLVHIVVNIV